MAGINPTDAEHLELLKESLRSAVRFPALANTGGAIASVSIIGATAKDGHLVNILALPLGLFLLGVFVTLLSAARAMYIIVAKGEEPRPMQKGFNWVRTALHKQSDSLHLIPVALFFLGCVSGIIIIVFT